MKKLLIAILLITSLSVSFLASAEPQQIPTKTQPATVKPKPPSWLEYKNPYVGEGNNIARAHRTTAEIANWAQQAAADSLSFRKANYKRKLKSFKRYFVQEGWKFYAAYLKETKLINMIVDDGYTVSTIVNELPEIINHGASENIYHWIIKMPVTISFFEGDTYKNPKIVASGKYLLYLDIGRVTKEDIAIMNWDMRDMPIK